MADAVLQYQHLSPEQKLARITQVAANMTLGEAPVHSEVTIMRLALELAAEYSAARAATAITPPTATSSLLKDQMAERLATTLEENQRLRQKARDGADLLVAKNREIEGLRTQIRVRDGRIGSLELALKNPVHPSYDQNFREFDQLLRTAPTSRG